MSTVLTLVAGLLVSLMTATSASAAPSPVAAPTANTVTADALPTVQVDGVVWAQAITGNTVYAGGSFANARPAGAAAATDLTPRSNLLSYDLATGALNTSFAPSLNAQAKAVAVSPDGSRVYVGGQFTAADGANRYRIAAYSTATGTLLASFAPSLDATVNAIVATNSTVYVGGLFNTANGNARNKLAAFNASNGALLTWNPSADSIVQAMVVTPDGSKIIVGGAFQNVSGQPAYGLAAVDAVRGTLLPWNATTVVRDAGTQSSIMSLATDGNAIYGSGYVFGSGGNLEGTFSADPNTGNINWIEDCHGDTYGVYANGGVVYDVSHAHYCGNIGGFPQTDPQPKWTFHHAMAFTAQATGTVGHDPKGYFDFYGNPSPSIINWFPDLTTGTVTGQSQAAWTITGNANYVVLGGEFPSVNGAAQQGLVRFVRKPTAPSKQGPMVSGGNFKPTLVPLGSGTVRVSWQANWDRDDKTLTYKVIRNENIGAPAYTTTADSTFWNRPTLGFVDSGLTPGVSYRYRLYVTDPSGNQVAGDTMAITAPSAAANKPPTAAFSASKTDLKVSVNASASTDSDGTVASYAWNFGDGTTATGALAQHAYATAGNYTITLTVTDDKGATDVLAKQVSVVAPNVPPSAAFTATAADLTMTVDGSTSADTDGSVAAWAWDFGDGTTDTGSSVSHAYAKAGTYVVKLTVTDDRGATDSTTKSLTVAAANVPPTAAFTSTTTNLAVSVDGSTSSDPDGTVAGYAWTFGDGGTASTKTASHTYAAAGTYSVKLTVTDNRGATNTTTQSIKVSAADVSPTASFTAAATALKMSVDASASTDPDGTVTGYGWDFGDGGTATGKTAEHTYAAAGTYTTTLKVTDNQGATGSLSKSVTVTAAPGTGVYAADSFGRAASNGWGTADTGGAWTVAGGAGLFSVGGGSGRITLNAPGAGPTALLGAVSKADVVSVVDTSLNKPATGNGVIVALIARHSGNSDYRLKERFMSDGTMHLILSKVVGGAETTLREIVVAGLTYTPGDVLRVRFQVKGTGTTSINGKVWKVGGTEPAAAQVSATDSEGTLQAAGSVGLQSYLSGSSTNAPLVTTYDNLSVTAS